MEEHLIEVHEELEKFYCSVCDLRFRTKKVFKAHGREFHDFVDVKGRAFQDLFFRLDSTDLHTIKRWIFRGFSYLLPKLSKLGKFLCKRVISNQSIQKNLKNILNKKSF